jgi:hypothetical protein
LNGTTQRFSARSHLVQFALHVADVGRATVWLHPEQLLEVNGLALASSFVARLLVASISACCDMAFPSAPIRENEKAAWDVMI